jgi:hypothetical protein
MPPLSSRTRDRQGKLGQKDDRSIDKKIPCRRLRLARFRENWANAQHRLLIFTLAQTDRLFYGLHPVRGGFGHRGGGLGCGTYGPVGRGARGIEGMGVGTAA